MSPEPIPAGSPLPRRFDALTAAWVVLALTVSAAVAVPILQRQQRHASARALAADLVAARAAFQSYAREHGDWPPADAAPGQPPSGMAESLRDTNWQRPSPLGGYYAWKLSTLHQAQRYAAAIVLTSTPTSAFRIDREVLVELEQAIDDGDFAAGDLRLGFRNQPVLVLEH